MKLRKNLLLSDKAIERGERKAAQAGVSLSALVEKKLLADGDDEAGDEHYWPKAMKPRARPGDARYEYLKRKHL
jgi:hypothetical protein